MANRDYKVIEIIDEYSLLINYGSINGAIKGVDIRIISIGPEVTDPTTGEVLGTMDQIKAYLTITVVYDRFSICQRVKEKIVNSLLNPLSQLQITMREKSLLNVDEKDITHKKSPDDVVIRPGDIVEIL